MKSKNVSRKANTRINKSVIRTIFTYVDVSNHTNSYICKLKMSTEKIGHRPSGQMGEENPKINLRKWWLVAQIRKTQIWNDVIRFLPGANAVNHPEGCFSSPQLISFETPTVFTFFATDKSFCRIQKATNSRSRFTALSFTEINAGLNSQQKR